MYVSFCFIIIKYKNYLNKKPKEKTNSKNY